MEIAERKLKELEQTGYRLRIKDYFNEAVELFKAETGLFVLFTVVYLTAQGGLNFVVPIVGPLAAAVLTPPLSVGYYYAVYKIRNGQGLSLGDFFHGFNLITPLVVSSLIGGAISLIGLFFFILPGIYFGVAYSMASFFVVFFNMSGWDALEASRRLVHRQWWDVFVLVLAVVLLDVLGLIFLGVGLLVTVPLSNIMLYLFFEDVMSVGNEGEALVDSLGR
jgi:uncharacterized membrane protein